MHEITELIRAVIWPITVLAVFVILKTELQRLTKNIADRIQNANSISIGPRGVELKGLVKAVPVPQEVQTRKVALARFVRGLTNRPVLDEIADALNLPRSTDVRTQIGDIILETNRRVQTVREMDALSSLLRPVTGQDF